MESRHSRSVSTTPHPPAAIPPSPPSSPSVPTPRSPASPFRFTGHTQAQFSSSTFSPPPSSPHASPSPAGSPQRPLSSMSSNSVILSLAELFPVGSQEPRSDTSLASADGETSRINWGNCCVKLAVFVHLTCFHPLLRLSCILAGQTGTQIFHSPSEFGLEMFLHSFLEREGM